MGIKVNDLVDNVLEYINDATSELKTEQYKQFLEVLLYELEAKLENSTDVEDDEDNEDNIYDYSDNDE